MIALPASPYPWRESLATAARMFQRPAPWTGATRGGIALGAGEARARVIFAGDVLPVRTSRVTLNADLVAWFAGADAVVANLEGILTERPWLPFLQKHTPATLDALARLAPPDRWRLGLANNHAGDYGRDAFDAHVAALRTAGFAPFGMVEVPTVTVGAVSVTTWTAWQNRPSPWVATAPTPPGPGWSVASPHQGAEFVRGPGEAAPGFAATLAHHAHLAGDVGVQDGRLVAASLGNLLTEVKVPPMGEGLLVSVTIGDAGPIAADWARIAITRAWGRVEVRLA